MACVCPASPLPRFTNKWLQQVLGLLQGGAGIHWYPGLAEMIVSISVSFMQGPALRLWWKWQSYATADACIT